MALIKSCCCWRSLRRGCYASAIYTMVYFSVTIITMGHFIEVEQRYLHGEMTHPESESFLEPDKITPITVSLNITLLACSALGLISCVFLILGVYKDIKLMLLPWIMSMGLETLVEIINLVYLFYLQTLNFNPITAFLFTLDFFIIVLNVYAMICVISQFQEYMDGRGTADFDRSDWYRQINSRTMRNSTTETRYRDKAPPGAGMRKSTPSMFLAGVQYTATAQHTTTTSSAPSGRRRSAAKPVPSRCDPEEFSEVPAKTLTSVLSRSSRPAVKKHVQFPDDQICVEEATDAAANIEEKPKSRVISSLWMELECEAAAGAGSGAGAER